MAARPRGCAWLPLKGVDTASPPQAPDCCKTDLTRTKKKQHYSLEYRGGLAFLSTAYQRLKFGHFLAVMMMMMVMMIMMTMLMMTMTMMTMMTMMIMVMIVMMMMVMLIMMMKVTIVMMMMMMTVMTMMTMMTIMMTMMMIRASSKERSLSYRGSSPDGIDDIPP